MRHRLSTIEQTPTYRSVKYKAGRSLEFSCPEATPHVFARTGEARNGVKGRIEFAFHRIARSLLEELSRHAPDLLPKIAVVDFNPAVYAFAEPLVLGARFIVRLPAA